MRSSTLIACLVTVITISMSALFVACVETGPNYEPVASNADESEVAVEAVDFDSNFDTSRPDAPTAGSTARDLNLFDMSVDLGNNFQNEGEIEDTRIFIPFEEEVEDEFDLVSEFAESGEFSKSSQVRDRVATETCIRDDLYDDTQVMEAYPSNNYGSRGHVTAGYYDYPGDSWGWTNAFFKAFSCPSEPSTITGATLWVWRCTSATCDCDNDGVFGEANCRQLNSSTNFKVCRIEGSWSEGTVTWTNRPSRETSFFDETGAGAGVTGWDWFDATTALQRICDDGYANYGISLYSASSSPGYMDLGSDETPGAYNAYLDICYTDCEPNSCDDGNPCTTDSYDGCHCQYTNNTNSCDDGQYCTVNDQCGGGSCNGGGARTCSNANYCDGVEYCDEGANTCVSPGNPCSDDGAYCNGNESCNEANDSCQHSGNPCPDNGQYCDGSESCDEGTNSCTSPDPCGDDGLFCNGAEGCNESTNQCTHAGSPCQPGDTCNEPTDQCFDCVTDGDCNDSNACTDDACVSSSCQHTNN